MSWRKGTAGVDIGSLAELAVEWLASGKQVQLPAFISKASAGKELSETGDYWSQSLAGSTEIAFKTEQVQVCLENYMLHMSFHFVSKNLLLI